MDSRLAHHHIYPKRRQQVLGTRNDGIVIVQLRTSLDKPYLGYFHLSQVRQCLAGGNNADQNDAMAMEEANNGGGARVCGKRGSLDEGEQAPQRVRGPVPFSDMSNVHMGH